ncbi:MAG: DUF3667 domain-containing protein [Syntrophomonadaceae bacterium]
MSHNHSKPEACLNCGYQFKDENNYCPSCGQQNHTLNVPFKHLVLEFLEGTIHLDTKIFQTFKFLLFKPGFLTREFNTGKRATYVPPVRIYVFVSFIFFLLAGYNSGHKFEEKGNKIKDKKSLALLQIGPSDTNDKASIQKRDSLLASKAVKNSAIAHFALSMSKKSEGTELNHIVLKNISYLMFFLMPLFAFFVFLFNSQRGHYYYEFLIYSIHLHSFLFILFIFFVLIMTFLFESGWLVFAAIVISIYYFIVSMKNAFPQKTSQALLKSLSLVVIYGITILAGLVGTAVISYLMV